MRKNIKKLGAGLLAGCGGDGKSSGGKTEITFGIWGENQRPAMEQMVEAYEKEHDDVTIKIQLTPYKDYFTKLETSATGGKAPDVFWVNVLHLDAYVEGGILADLTDAVADSDIPDSYSETLLNNYVRDGKNYGVPKDFDTNALWYNKEMFDEAGVAYPTDDMSYDDLVALATELKDKLPDAMFEGEQIAMNFAGSYIVPEYAANETIKDKIDCVEIPTFNGKEDNVINGLAYCVFEGSKNKDAATDFAIWLGSSEAQEIQGKTGVVISARTDAQHCFAEANDKYNLAAYTNHADEAYPLPVCNKAAELYDLEAQYIKQAYDGTMTLKEACTQLKQEADALLAE